MARAVPVIVGWLVLAVAVDLGAGTLLERVHPQDVPGRPPLAPAATADIEVATTSPAMPPTCLGHATLTPENRIHATEGPVADLPWNEEFWCEFGRLRQEYVPFLLARTADTRQRLINVRGGVRRSYQPPGADDGAPVIWFFGGSTMWGWGQRDGHTIASEVARLSERAGLPVRVVNFGSLAWVHWQEVLAFERELAHREAPDLVVFYDGINDTNVQGGVAANARPSDDPTIYDFGDDPPPRVPAVLGRVPAEPRDGLWERWVDHSAVAQLAAGAGGALGLVPAPAAAERAQDAPPPDVMARRALDVYERGREVALALAARHGVDPHFFWQPRVTNLPDEVLARVDAPAVREEERTMELTVLDGLTPPTVDLSHAFDAVDPDDVFTDGAHTTEAGARLVAEALWAELLPSVRAAHATSRQGAG